jgi:hypothetical protein
LDKLIKQKTSLLVNLQKKESPSLLNQIRTLQKEIDELLKCEEMRWKQRAKQHWFRYGDRNTAFFHSWAQHRRRINNIQRICDEQGRVWRKRRDISRVFLDYYNRLFSSQGSERVEECLSFVTPRVSDEMNSRLLQRFTEDEVRRALFQMHPLKSPGPDGFPAVFYQKYWNIVGRDVCQAVLSYLNGGTFDVNLNVTNIVLIPKVNSPAKLTDYRPISLCNVLYKLISKVLANRLKMILPYIISPEESAFVPGRLITDNVLVAFETLHTMATRLAGKDGYMALKLDMSKAYDRMEWNFLEVMLCRLGFAERWINLLMPCIRTVSYSILLNGRPYGQITPSRGLRQGDPLSPYLFILCAEALSTLIRSAGNDGNISGVPLSRGGLRINHFFFTDDSLLFCKANLREWRCVQNLLNVYEEASGQKNNREKTSVLNTKQDLRASIVQEVGAVSTQHFEKYLGLPALIGHSRISSFNFIKGRIWTKLNGWKEKLLTHAGKEILLKTVIQAIPIYTMSVFRLPKTLLKEINALMGKFWWGFKENISKIAWMSWKQMGWSKDFGGLGCRELDCFNMAMLAKQGWRLLQYPDSLVARVMQEKYYKGFNFLGSELGKRPSYAWRSIWQVKSLIEEGMVWRVGNGLNLNLWEDKWIISTHSHKIQDPIRVLSKEAKVADIIDLDSNWWNVPLIEQIFSPETVERICSIPISPRSQEDKLIWARTKTGVFSVRSAYHLEMERRTREMGSVSSRSDPNPYWRRLWKLRVPRYIILFLWRASNDILPTKHNLFRRKVVADPLCPMCACVSETSAHVLWECDAARAIWSLCGGPIQKSSLMVDNFFGIFCYLCNRLEDSDLELFAMLAHKIWIRRNRLVFDGVVLPPNCLLKGAIEDLEEFRNSFGDVLTPMTGVVAPPPQWSAPAVGNIKIN